jgi:hypothetical protein
MKRFFKSLLLPAVIVFAIFVHGTSLTGCTDVDDTLGLGMLPDGDHIQLSLDSVGGIKTYLAKSDSIQSSFRNRMIIGSRLDPDFGQTVCGTMVTMYPTSSTFNDKNLYGFRPVADSLFIVLYINTTFGDTTKAQTFYIYELADTLKRDSVYYQNISFDKLIDYDKPLFSFTLQSEKSKQVIKKLTPLGDEGPEFMQRIVTTDSTILADPYYTFREHFPGLYITPKPAASDPSEPELADAAIYDIALYEDATYMAYSLLNMYAHNYKRSDPSVVDTTVNAGYLFADTYPLPNMSINKVIHKYPENIERVLNDTLPDSPTLSTIYVQGLSGVASYLRFSDEFFDQIAALKTYEGEQYSKLIVNQARLYIYMDEFTTENLQLAPARLGMYKDYKGSYPTPIIDYPYDYESTYSVPYGGYLNRSNGYYTMDITSQVSYMLNNKESLAPHDIWLGPDAYTIPTLYSQVKLRGYDSERPIKLQLTYTLVR